MPNTLQAEDPICPSCGQDDIECLENCTLHKCVHCNYSERTDHTHEIETTPDYWDCECADNYIHRKTDTLECLICQSSQEEQPDSRTNEVALHLQPVVINNNQVEVN